ncbi:DNA-damage-inducible protein J [Ruminococcaceae bacterium YRB3002]|nr:DNA-damage-inducible protein J [Ruminococcaceae bacterium YRB3002]
MAKSVNMCVRIDPELKAQAEEILDQLGMNMNGTINMFLTQIVREKRVPLNLSLNAGDNIMSDIRIAKQEREQGIEGVDARSLLEEMKRIVADAEAKESSFESKAAI